MLARMILVLALLALPAKAESLDALYQKAKGEGTLVLYGGGPAANYEGPARAFEKRFPGIAVAVTGGFSNVLNAKIEEQAKAKKFAADLAIFQTVQDFVHWKGRGLLLAFKPEGFAEVGAAYKDKDGAWLAVSLSPLFYAYNTEHVSASQVPKSALDFLRPEFRGKLVTAYPADDDATLYLFYRLVKKYGWGFMDKYMALEPRFIQGHLGVARSIASGESLVSFDATMSTTASLKRQGATIATVPSARDETPVFFVTAGIFKGAPHPNAAKLYLSWLLSKDVQARTGFYSPRTDVAAPAGYPPLASLKLANRYRQFVTDDKLIAELRKRFESYSGPVKNAGGVK
jgi:ABC-type Fe3+ transport system substrate-binding protein